MSTPMDAVCWKIHAWCKGNWIYLKSKSDDQVTDTASEVEKTAESFLRMSFHRMLTLNSSAGAINESDKVLKVSRIQIGTHNLISMTESCARDVDGDEVSIFLKKVITEKDHKVSFYNGKYFNLWAEAQITNASHIIIGKCNAQRFLQSIAVIDMDTENMVTLMSREVSQDDGAAKVWDPSDARCFLNRFLSFVRKILRHDQFLDDGRLVSFEYVSKVTKVIVPQIVPLVASFDVE